MKINVSCKLSLSRFLAAALLVVTSAAQAQSFIATSYRGLPGTESAMWSYSFTNDTGGANVATTVAPGGSALANASISEINGNSSQYLLASDGMTFANPGGIYSSSLTADYVLNYSDSAATFVDGIGNVTFQIAMSSSGSQINLNSIFLTYGSQTFSYASEQLSGGILDLSWDLSQFTYANNFSISFNAAAAHSFLQGASLDVAGVSVVPEPGPAALLGMVAAGLMAFRFYRRQIG